MKARTSWDLRMTVTWRMTRWHAGRRRQTRGVDQIVLVVTAQRLVSEASTRTHSVSSIGRSELPARA